MLKVKKERYLQNLLEEEKGDGVYPDVLVRGQQWPKQTNLEFLKFSDSWALSD